MSSRSAERHARRVEDLAEGELGDPGVQTEQERPAEEPLEVEVAAVLGAVETHDGTGDLTLVAEAEGDGGREPKLEAR